MRQAAEGLAAIAAGGPSWAQSLAGGPPRLIAEECLSRCFDFDAPTRKQIEEFALVFGAGLPSFIAVADEVFILIRNIATSALELIDPTDRIIEH